MLFIAFSLFCLFALIPFNNELIYCCSFVCVRLAPSSPVSPSSVFSSKVSQTASLVSKGQPRFFFGTIFLTVKSNKSPLRKTCQQQRSCQSRCYQRRSSWRVLRVHEPKCKVALVPALPPDSIPCGGWLGVGQRSARGWPGVGLHGKYSVLLKIHSVGSQPPGAIRPDGGWLLACLMPQGIES
jgi:hypothetical protein